MLELSRRMSESNIVNDRLKIRNWNLLAHSLILLDLRWLMAHLAQRNGPDTDNECKNSNRDYCTVSSFLVFANIFPLCTYSTLKVLAQQRTSTGA